MAQGQIGGWNSPPRRPTQAPENGVVTPSRPAQPVQPLNGKDGEPGKAATIAVDSVTVGDVPSVTNVGTPTDAKLAFVLPAVDYDKLRGVIADELKKQPKPPTVDEVAAVVIERLPKVEPCKCEQKKDVEHLVLVADESAQYWPRLKGEYDMARGNYSAFKLAPPPPFSVQLPQLILYRNNNPIKQKVGLREVSQALSAIYRGESF